MRARLKAGGGSVQNLWVSPRALMLQFAPDRRAGIEAGMAWVFLLNPAQELWLLHEKDPAFQLLRAEAKVDLSRRWLGELKGARLEDLEGDPRERWIAMLWRRRAITGRIEVMRFAFQAIPGRGGLRLDGLDLNPARLGLGALLSGAAPEVEADTPPLRRWRERFGEAWEAALAGEREDVLPGEGPLMARHRAWSLERAAKLLLSPKQAGEERKLRLEAERLERYGQGLEADRLRHRAALDLKIPATALSAELWRLKGQAGTVELENGQRLELPPGQRAEETVQRWFAAAKRAERGLLRVDQLERDRQRQVRELQRRMGEGVQMPTITVQKNKESKRMEKTPGRPDKRADGKGKAHRSLMVEGFEVLIGKGDADNDNLTFKVANGVDFWLHVANVPGSHVIVRNPDRVSELPRPVLERAAQLAAFYSKARDAGKVEVHWCRAADVSKPRGFEPGKVLLKRFQAVRVYPKE